MQQPDCLSVSVFKAKILTFSNAACINILTSPKYILVLLDTNAAWKEMEDILNTSIMELIYSEADPSTYPHFNAAQTTPDLLLVSSDITASTKCTILDEPGSGHKPVIAKMTLTQQHRMLDSYIRTSWNFKKANWRSFTDMLLVNLHQERIDFSQQPDKIGKVINSSNITVVKLASQEEE